ncbi:substrate-binding periplasmic protein [Rathayibacter soli]|uniref:substrate-binding periplasmic protein n=1 Tax=Rathayibacter soli TaxID=3144168 RepID=UPI0027E40C28|nr:transporter substrate-binding domain-containing protein [Glaciibacter superstes]
MTKNIVIQRAVRAAALLSISALALAGCATTSSDASTTAAAAGCTPADPGLTTYTAGVLTVGVPQNPPYTVLNGNKASGYEIDIVNKLAAAECLPVSYIPVTYGNGIAMINNQKRADLITGGWYVTPARAQQVGFTSPIDYDEMAIISKSGIDTVKGLESIGAVGSATGFSWQGDMTKVLGDNLKSYPGTVEIKQDLQAGRIQAGLDGYAVAVDAYKGTDFKVEIAKKDPRIAITIDRPITAFPINKSNKALNDALSKLIDQYRKDGTLAKILTAHGLSASLVVPADVAAKSLR